MSGDERVRPNVPGYELLAEIGHGGFGTIYRARQLSVEREVAIKVVSVQALGAATERRFRAECQTIGQLSWHPHIVPLYDAGVTAEGTPFLVMELMSGGSLADRLRSGSVLSPLEVLRTGAQIADALGAAHDAGVVHRDVKPANCFVDRRGSVRLGDFGVAMLRDSSQTVTASFVGTVAYTAPEVFQGQRASTRSDLFALGATLYELLAGRSPFASGAPDDSLSAAMWRIANEPLPPLPSTVPQPLVEILEQATSKDPAARQSSAALFRSQLDAATAQVDPHTSVTVDDTNGTAALSVVGEDEGEEEATRDSQVSATAVEPDRAAMTDRRGSLPPDRPLRQAGQATSSRGRRRLTIALVACVLLGAAAIIIVRSRHTPSTSTATSDPQKTPSVLSSPRRIPVGARPGTAAVASGAIWVPNRDGSSVSQIRTDEPGRVTTIAIRSPDGEPIVPQTPAVTSDAIWVPDSSGDTITRIDVETGKVTDAIRVGSGPTTPAVVGDALWVPNTKDDTVMRVDLESKTASEPIGVGPRPVTPVAAADVLWVPNSGGDTISRIDLTSNTALDPVTVGSDPHSPAVTRDAVWVSNFKDTFVSRIDVRTLNVTKIEVGRAPESPVVMDGSVWVSVSGDDKVTAIDSRTAKPDHPIDVGDQPGTPVVADGALWVPNYRGGTISRITTSEGEVKRIRVGKWPVKPAVTGDAVWASNAGDNTVSPIPL